MLLLTEKLKDNSRGTTCQTLAVVLYCYTITKINIKIYEMKELKAIIPNLLFELLHTLKNFHYSDATSNYLKGKFQNWEYM